MVSGAAALRVAALAGAVSICDVVLFVSGGGVPQLMVHVLYASDGLQFLLQILLLLFQLGYPLGQRVNFCADLFDPFVHLILAAAQNTNIYFAEAIFCPNPVFLLTSSQTAGGKAVKAMRTVERSLSAVLRGIGLASRWHDRPRCTPVVLLQQVVLV